MITTQTQTETETGTEAPPPVALEEHRLACAWCGVSTPEPTDPAMIITARAYLHEVDIAGRLEAREVSGVLVRVTRCPACAELASVAADLRTRYQGVADAALEGKIGRAHV